MIFNKAATLVLLPDKRSWKERQRVDPRKRDRRGYKRPDVGRKRDRRGYKRPDAGRKRDRSGYKRPDAGKRPRTHSVPVVKKEARFEELEEKRKKEALMHGQLASLSTAADDWNDTEVGEESEMDSQYDFPECRTSHTAPRWLDEPTEIPSEEYNSNNYQLTDTLEYRIFLPHSAPNCGMTTTFSDLCDYLCEPLKHAHYVSEKRRRSRFLCHLVEDAPLCCNKHCLRFLVQSLEEALDTADICP